jgi:Asp-tRNA(Asn)/Glu-tRNA(Gln) amidotransferase A subunit family amidase
VQIAGPPFAEARILKIGAALEDAGVGGLGQPSTIRVL